MGEANIITSQKSKFSIQALALIGTMAALVFAASWISIIIPTAIGNTRIHLGNVICLMSGLILGPVGGGFAAGFGSMFYDFTNPLFIADAPFTFIFKFIMAFVCGKIARTGNKDAKHIGTNIFAAICGALFYVVLYLCKEFIRDYYFLRMAFEAVILTTLQKGLISSINAIIAVIVAVPLSQTVRVVLDRIKS